MAEKGPKKKALPDDAEAYVAMAREKSSPSGRIMERVKAANQLKLESMTTELEAAQLENALKSVKGVSPAQTESIAAQLFKGKSAEEIAEILENLTPEMVQKMQMLQKATDPMMAAMGQQTQQPQSGNDKLLEYLLKKTDEKQQGITMADVVAIVKLVNDTKPAPAPVIQQAPQQNPLASTLETIKVISAMNEPVYKLMSAKDKEIMDMKLREIENKMPQDPIETIKYVKEMSGALGLGNAKSEIDLRLEEMRQNRDVDNRRLDWEQKKYELEQEADMEKWKQISSILQGPVGQAIQGLGNAGADRVRGGRTPPKTVQTQCPNCKSVIFVDAAANTAICGNCGAQLQRQGAPTPPAPPDPQAPTHVYTPADTPAEEEEVAEEGEQEIESDETEETEPEAQQQ